MAVTINGSDTAAGDTGGLGFTSAEGLILTGQGSSNDVTIKNDADGTVAVIPTGTTNFGFDSGFGSAGVAYGVRAWVKFNGTGTVGIKASGNVSSITDNAVGNYTVNFATNMPDVDYCVSGTTGIVGNNNVFIAGATDAPTVSAYRFNARATGNTNLDVAILNVNFIR